MSTKTKNYNLVKPDLTDPADITGFNENWDIIDEELGKTKEHKHSADDITSGVLSIARGGTGASTAEEARRNLGIAENGVLFNGSVVADSAVNVSLAEGEIAQVVFRFPKTEDGDIFVKVNGVSPTTSSYCYIGANDNYGGGRVGLAGSSLISTLVGTLTLYDGVLELSFTGRRGRDSAGTQGYGTAAWDNVTSVASIECNKACKLLIKKL